MTDGPIRRDPRKARGASRREGPDTAPAKAPPATVTAATRDWSDEDSARCLVVLEAPNGRLSSLDRVLLGGAREIADAGELVVAIAFAALQEDVAAAGADALVELPSLGGFCPRSRLAALMLLRVELSAATVLLGETGDSADLGRRLAVAIGASVATDVVALERTEVVRNPGKGQTEWVGSQTPVMFLTASACAPYSGAPRPLIKIPMSPVEPQDEVAVELRTTTAEPDAVSLEEARFIVSAGAGVSDWGLFDRLAQTLRASRGGSRVVCDAGSVPRQRQIGASGLTVSADCYLALGISGAPQHLSGIEKCGYVIAVNRDRQAPIFGRANLGFVADADELMRALVDLAATRRLT